ERVAAHIPVDAFADLLDDADDLMAENSRAWIWPTTLVGMNIRPADGRHGHPHQNLPALGGAHGKLLENERCVGRLVYSSLGGTHCAEPFPLSGMDRLHYSTP